MVKILSNWSESKRGLEIDIQTIKDALYQLQTVGTPESQQTDDYKHLHTAIESLGALLAVLENKYQQVLRIEARE